MVDKTSDRALFGPERERETQSRRPGKPFKLEIKCTPEKVTSRSEASLSLSIHNALSFFFFFFLFDKDFISLTLYLHCGYGKIVHTTWTRREKEGKKKFPGGRAEGADASRPPLHHLAGRTV